MNKNLRSFAIAATAVFATGAMMSAPAQAKSAPVHCSGVNSCKGTSECKTASNECKGQNTCKGQGWVTKKSAKACKAGGGIVAK